MKRLAKFVAGLVALLSWQGIAAWRETRRDLRARDQKEVRSDCAEHSERSSDL